ncbi:MAG TPA: DUF2244 domain-containing protein [Rhodopila sp.]
MSAADAPVFEAFIAPHRSLTGKAAAFIIAGMLVFSSGIALRCWIWGAWPVVALSLLDVPLLVLLLAINQRRARASELIILDQAGLTVIRTDPRGVRARNKLPAAWLRIDLHNGPGIPRVVLSSRGRTCEVGAFLHESEKIALFDALRDGVYRVRNPRFDNPQLREE